MESQKVLTSQKIESGWAKWSQNLIFVTRWQSQYDNIRHLVEYCTVLIILCGGVRVIWPINMALSNRQTVKIKHHRKFRECPAAAREDERRCPVGRSCNFIHFPTKSSQGEVKWGGRNPQIMGSRQSSFSFRLFRSMNTAPYIYDLTSLHNISSQSVPTF